MLNCYPLSLTSSMAPCLPTPECLTSSLWCLTRQLVLAFATSTYSSYSIILDNTPAFLPSVVQVLLSARSFLLHTQPCSILFDRFPCSKGRSIFLDKSSLAGRWKTCCCQGFDMAACSSTLFLPNSYLRGLHSFTPHHSCH